MSKPPSPFALRVATLLFPPAGVVLLWQEPVSLARKIFGSIGIALYCVPYSALLIFLLVRFAGLQMEWRGGYVPALTWRTTRPDFEALERSRSRVARSTPPARPPSDTNAYWTGLRGPRGDGRYDEQPIHTNWSAAGPKLLWRQPCGGGYASFAIGAGLAFTIEQRRESEVAFAYEVESGREAWTHGWPARFGEYYSGEGPRATPALNSGCVFALGAQGELRCLAAADGRLIWATNVLADVRAEVPAYGISASPLIVDEKLIVLTGAGRGRSVVCYDKHAGRRLWSALDDATGYATPVSVTIEGERQLVICSETSTAGLRLEDGAVRWRFAWSVRYNQPPIAQPVQLGANRFLLSAGYFTGCAAFEVTRSGDGFATRELWRSSQLKNKFTSSIYHEGFIYGLDEDILTCLDAADGGRKWKDGRYGYGQIILASDHLVVLCGDGDLALVKATPERHFELARLPGIHGKTWNHAALGGGRLLVRNAAEMACFDLGAK